MFKYATSQKYGATQMGCWRFGLDAGFIFVFLLRAKLISSISDGRCRILLHVISESLCEVVQF